MPACPICNQSLDIQRQREGLFYSCAKCGGRALTIPQIRRVSGDRLGAKLVRLLSLSRPQSSYKCPFCRERMLSISLTEPPLAIEGCRPCNAVWFDAPTYETLPEGVGESTNAMTLLATEVFAENKLKELKEREAREEAERKKKRKQRGFRDL